MKPEQILKSINRWARKYRKSCGYQPFGFDYITWRINHPHISAVFQENAEKITGRNGRFMPATLK